MRTKKLISLRIDEITLERLQQLAPYDNISTIIRQILKAMSTNASKDVVNLIVKDWIIKDSKAYEMFRSKIIIEGYHKYGENFRIE